MILSRMIYDWAIKTYIVAHVYCMHQRFRSNIYANCMVVLGLCGSFYLFKRVFWSKLAGVSEW